MNVRVACQMSMRWALILAAGLCLLARSARAQDDDASRQGANPQAYRFEIRADYLWDHFSNSQALIEGNTFTSLNFNGRPGAGVDFEYRFVPTFGIDFAASQTSMTGKEVTTNPVGPPVEARADIRVVPITIGIVEHPFQFKHVDFYIGLIAGVVDMSGDNFRSAEARFGFGSLLGVDIPIGQSGFAINAVGKVLSSRFSNQFTGESHFHDTFLYGGGLTYRW
jgi:hypothetical protein